MKAIFSLIAVAAILLLGSLTISTGQNSPHPMYTSPAVSATLCNKELTNCSTNESNNCGSEHLTLDAGDYYLHAWINCTPPIGAHCDGCYACAHLIRLSDNADMFPGGAQSACDAPCDVTLGPQTLEAGDYRLFVCKKPCTDHNCDLCSIYCTAWAQVHG